MQSPTKLQKRISDLLGPPDPEADGLELTLRTVVAMGAPAIQSVLEQHDADSLDRQLEHVAIFFLGMRSDGVPLSDDFRADVDRLEAEPGEVDGTAVDEPAAIPGGPAAAVTAPAEVTPPAPVTPPAEPAPAAGGSFAQPAAAPASSYGDGGHDEPAPAADPPSGGSTSPTDSSSTSHPAAAGGGSSSSDVEGTPDDPADAPPPAPPWGG